MTYKCFIYTIASKEKMADSIFSEQSWNASFAVGRYTSSVAVLVKY